MASVSLDDPVLTRFGDRPFFIAFGCWTLFGILQGASWLVAPHSPPGVYMEVHPLRTVVSAIVNAWLWALLTPPVFRLANWVNATDHGRVRRWLVAIGVGLAIGATLAITATLVHRVFAPRVPGTPLAGARGIVLSFNRWYIQEMVTFAVVIMAGIATAVSRRYRERERHAARLEAQSAALHAQLAEARLAVLQTRLNPHFLFNTLNAVSALVSKDPQRVRDMIALLSELLRYALADSREQEIPVREELRLLRVYLEILEIRYQGQLRTKVVADDDVQHALVPTLVLQPIVENAMKHGIEPAGGHGTIEVDVSREGSRVVLSVRNTGPANDGGGPEPASGVGLQLTRDRLAGLYGEAYELRLEPNIGGGMSARIDVPYHTGEQLAPNGIASGRTARAPH